MRPLRLPGAEEGPRGRPLRLPGAQESPRRPAAEAAGSRGGPAAVAGWFLSAACRGGLLPGLMETCSLSRKRSPLAGSGWRSLKGGRFWNSRGLALVPATWSLSLQKWYLCSRRRQREEVSVQVLDPFGQESRLIPPPAPFDMYKAKSYKNKTKQNKKTGSKKTPCGTC